MIIESIKKDIEKIDFKTVDRLAAIEEIASKYCEDIQQTVFDLDSVVPYLEGLIESEEDQMVKNILFKMVMLFCANDVPVLSESISSRLFIPSENGFKKTNSYSVETLKEIAKGKEPDGTKCFLLPYNNEKEKFNPKIYSEILEHQNYYFLCCLYTEFVRLAQSGQTTNDINFPTKINFEKRDLYKMAGINAKRLSPDKTKRIYYLLDNLSGTYGIVVLKDGSTKTCKLLNYDYIDTKKSYVTIWFPYYEFLESINNERKHLYLMCKDSKASNTSAVIRTVEIISQRIKTYNKSGCYLAFETILRRNQYLKYRYEKMVKDGKSAKQINDLFKRHMTDVYKHIIENTLLPDSYKNFEIFTISKGTKKAGLLPPSSTNIGNIKYQFTFTGKINYKEASAAYDERKKISIQKPKDNDSNKTNSKNNVNIFNPYEEPLGNLSKLDELDLFKRIAKELERDHVTLLPCNIRVIREKYGLSQSQVSEFIQYYKKTSAPFVK